MALSLTTPAGTDFIKDFPAQNQANCNKIDDYAGPCLIGQSLRQVNPILTASVTSPTLGTGGFNNAYYYQIFDQIYMWGEFRFGTGFSAGSGIYALTLPFTVSSVLGPDPTMLGKGPIVGQAGTWDQSLSAGRLPLTVHLKNSTDIYFTLRNNPGGSFKELRDTGYIVWAVQDGVSWSAHFKRLP